MKLANGLPLTTSMMRPSVLALALQYSHLVPGANFIGARA